MQSAKHQSAKQTKDDEHLASDPSSRRESSTTRRCWTCRRKVTPFSAIECKCGRLTCVAHRCPEDHECPRVATRKAELISKLQKQLPHVVAAKVAPM